MDAGRITDDDGKILVRTARGCVEEFLKHGRRPEPARKFEEKFSFNSGVFVTLNKNDSLRGCIGYVEPRQSLSNALYGAALSAATEDPRFEPVGSAELKDITFEITILGAPIEISVRDPAEYPSRIRIGRDGIVVNHAGRSGLLLPQVPVEYGWNSTEFLEHTCEKAGLKADAWKKKGTIVSRFEGIIFGEEAPNGSIVRHTLGD